MRSRALILAGSCLALTACGSLLESTLPAPQAYILRLPAHTASAPAAASAGSLLVQRPEAGPGLASEKIALLRSDPAICWKTPGISPSKRGKNDMPPVSLANVLI